VANQRGARTWRRLCPVRGRTLSLPPTRPVAAAVACSSTGPAYHPYVRVRRTSSVCQMAGRTVASSDTDGLLILARTTSTTTRRRRGFTHRTSRSPRHVVRTSLTSAKKSCFSFYNGKEKLRTAAARQREGLGAWPHVTHAMPTGYCVPDTP
jgi:hypothetical protein